jgi:hypothetical protein
MQCLAQDATEVAELWEEVTRAQAATIMVRARAAQVEGMAWVKAALLATTHDEVVEATQKVYVLGDELATLRQAKDATEEKILSLTAKVAVSNQWWEVAEE